MDREKVIKGLAMCEGQPETCGLKECPYYQRRSFCEEEMHADAVSLLKEQGETELCDRCGRRRLKSRRSI